MSPSADVKICKHCFTSIDARARKCPACHSLLGTRAFWAPVIVLLLFGAMLLMMVGAARLVELSRRRSTANHSSDVTIIESNLHLAPQSSYRSAGEKTIHPMMVGWVRNDGLRQLGNVYLEGRIFNDKGDLIDVIQGYASSSLKPGEKCAFKITGDEILRPESDYAKHTVVVTNALEQ